MILPCAVPWYILRYGYPLFALSFILPFRTDPGALGRKKKHQSAGSDGICQTFDRYRYTNLRSIGKITTCTELALSFVYSLGNMPQLPNVSRCICISRTANAVHGYSKVFSCRANKHRSTYGQCRLSNPLPPIASSWSTIQAI